MVVGGLYSSQHEGLASMAKAKKNGAEPRDQFISFLCDRGRACEPSRDVGVASQRRRPKLFALGFSAICNMRLPRHNLRRWLLPQSGRWKENEVQDVFCTLIAHPGSCTVTASHIPLARTQSHACEQLVARETGKCSLFLDDHVLSCNLEFYKKFYARGTV